MTPVQLNSLQVGRGLAALAVAAFHLSIGMAEPRYGGEAVFGDLTARGNLGVDFFFVLSGFIILHAHSGDIGRPEALTSYARKRFIRVFPIYWLYAGIFSALVILGVGSHASAPESLSEWLQTFTLVRLDNVDFPIPVAWTLVHEIAFYALFGVTIFSRAAGISLCLVWGALCLAMLQYPAPGERSAFTTYLAGWNLNFLLGMAAWWVAFHVSRKTGYILVAGGVFLVGATLLLEPSDLGPWLILYGVGFAAIVAGMVAGGLLTSPHPAFILLGNASYTIYLTHLPFEGLFLKIFMKLGATGPALYLSVLASTILTGVIAYLIVEKSLLRALKKGRPIKQTAILAT